MKLYEYPPPRSGTKVHLKGTWSIAGIIDNVCPDHIIVAWGNQGGSPLFITYVLEDFYSLIEVLA